MKSVIREWKKSVIKSVGLAVVALVFGTVSACGSDPIGVYGIVDKVVLEPNDQAPERVQLWGAFSIAEGRGYEYQTPVKGYLYYKLPEKKSEIARKEWADLKSLAGTSEVVGFGNRYEAKGRVRKPEEKPEAADIYPTGFGLQRARRTEYDPVKRLLEFHGKPTAAAKSSAATKQ